MFPMGSDAIRIAADAWRGRSRVKFPPAALPSGRKSTAARRIMEASPILFRDLTYIFLAAVAGGLVAWRVKLPLILGFVVGGIVISPFTPGPQLSDLHTFEVFAEVGVVLLMFSIGVGFSIPDLMRVKWVAVGGGSLGIMMSIALALVASWLAGWSIPQGIVVGATISVASTRVMARLLTDRGALGTTYGRVMIGITLVE